MVSPASPDSASADKYVEPRTLLAVVARLVWFLARAHVGVAGTNDVLLAVYVDPRVSGFPTCRPDRGVACSVTSSPGSISKLPDADLLSDGVCVRCTSSTVRCLATVVLLH